MLLLKTARWRNVIVLLVAVVVINFVNLPRVQAGWITDPFGSIAKKIGKKSGQGLANGIKPEFYEMVDHAGQKLSDHINNSVNWSNIGQELGKGASQEVVIALNSINWEEYGQQVSAGIRQEFEVAMDQLFEEKIKPLLKDIDLILKNRIGQVDNLIDDKLNKIDVLVKNTFDQFQAAADETIAKIKTDLIEYAFNRLDSWRDQTIVKIQTDMIDYTAETFRTISKETIKHTFTEFEQLRSDFRHDVNDFFDRTESLLTMLNCTEEKTRMDMENFIKTIGKEIEAKCPLYLCPSSNKAKDDPIVLACYKQLHIKKPPKSWQYIMIYKLEKCEVLSSLTPDTPVENVAAVYLDLHNWAKRVACIQQLSKNVVWDSLEFKSRYEYWSNQ